jgi:CDP-6-deoxy-D-xylo-4-hexulose-3-dehydrase
MRDSKALLLEQVRNYHRELATDEFVPGTTPVLSSGAALDEEDRVALVEAALDMRIAAGVSARRFEREFARYFGLRKAHMVNSGSSANLLALSALTSPQLEEHRLVAGDEVITVAAGFPTTVNPIIQNGLVPVFVDVELGTYNTTPERIEAAIGPRTRAIMVAHALGNPFAVAEVAEIAQRYGLFLVEDNCDAVGSTYNGKLTGTFGDLSTVSFYPAHHITTGEGGCVLTANLALARIVEQLRDWGRDCWCEPGEDNTCHKRFDYQAGTLPGGYDHKYIFSHVGYNLKATDLQAALGLTQLAKVSDFGAARRRNWQRLRDGLEDLPGLLMPSATPGSDPSWFGFVITVLPDAPFTRAELASFLESCKIGTRRFFGGNLTRHPAYLDREFRVSGDLSNSDLITERTFWVGVYPGLTTQMIDYVIECIRGYVCAAGSSRSPVASSSVLTS